LLDHLPFVAALAIGQLREESLCKAFAILQFEVFEACAVVQDHLQLLVKQATDARAAQR